MWKRDFESVFGYGVSGVGPLLIVLVGDALDIVPAPLLCESVEIGVYNTISKYEDSTGTSITKCLVDFRTMRRSDEQIVRSLGKEMQIKKGFLIYVVV